jgi:RNA polymerase sigma factor (sigma-70 family)
MANAPFTRETLLHRLRNPEDEGSWDDFSSCYRLYVFSIARAIGLPHHDCEDVVQDVLLRVWKRMPTFEYDANKGSFRRWLATVTRHQVWKMLSKNASDPSRPNVDGSDTETELTAAPEIEDIAQQEWEKFISNLAWERVGPTLSESVREAFVRLIAGEDAAAVARDMGMEKNTVYVYRQRVEKQLHREIRRLDDELA